MTKIYIVGSGLDYEHNGNIGIFSSKNKLLEFIKEHYSDFTLHTDERFPLCKHWLPNNRKARERSVVDFVYLEVWELNGGLVE